MFCMCVSFRMSYYLSPVLFIDVIGCCRGKPSFHWRPLFLAVTQRDLYGSLHYDLCHMRSKWLAHFLCCVWTRKRALVLFMEFFLLLLLIIGLRCSIQVGMTGYRLEGRDLILCNRNKSTFHSSCSSICEMSITLFGLSPGFVCSSFCGIPVKMKTST